MLYKYKILLLLLLYEESGKLQVDLNIYKRVWLWGVFSVNCFNQLLTRVVNKYMPAEDLFGLIKESIHSGLTYRQVITMTRLVRQH